MRGARGKMAIVVGTAGKGKSATFPTDRPSSVVGDLFGSLVGYGGPSRTGSLAAADGGDYLHGLARR